MLRTIAICPDPQIRGLWAEAIHNHREVALLKTVAAYPEADLLLRVMRAHVPEIVFIDMQDAEASAPVTRLIEKEFPGVQCVGLHPGAGPETLRQALRSGLREVLSPPFVRKDVDTVLAEVRRYLERQPATYRGAEHVLAFLPAKPGVGASTIASNAARAFSSHAGK